MSLLPDNLSAMAIEFVSAEFVPTLLALAAAGLREPMSWFVIGAGLLARWPRKAKQP